MKLKSIVAIVFAVVVILAIIAGVFFFSGSRDVENCAELEENVYNSASDGPTECCKGLTVERSVGSTVTYGRCISEEK